MADALGGNLTLRETQLRAVAGHPVSVTQVTLTQSLDFESLYTLSVRVSERGQVSVDNLLVLPRTGGDPGSAIEWEVSVAPS